MKDWIEKINFWFYDFMGLVVPSGLLLLLFIKPILEKISNIEGSIKIQNLFILGIVDKKSLKVMEILILIIILDMLGNIIKILSQLFYGFCNCLLDKFFFKIIKKFYDYFKYTVECYKNTNIIFERVLEEIKNFYHFLELNSLLKLLIEYYKYIIYFKTEKYNPENKFMIEEIVGKINEKNGTKFKKEWYTIYKLGKVYEENEGVKTLSSMFLAKYTLYRSLSFIFFMIGIYIIFINDNYLGVINISKKLFLCVIFFSWLSFHIKFKKYYKLCGNETLVGLYYKIVLKN